MSNFIYIEKIRRCFYIATLVVMSTVLASCSDDDDTPRLAPIAVAFDFVDENGDSYLDPSRPDGLFGKEIILDHNGTQLTVKDWELHSTHSATATNSLFPIRFNGLSVCYEKCDFASDGITITGGKCWLCYFIDGYKNYDDYITVSVPSLGFKQEIHVVRNTEYAKDGSVNSMITTYVLSDKHSSSFRFLEGYYQLSDLKELTIGFTYFDVLKIPL